MGLFSGVVVLILGITGCIYAFKEEIKPIVYHDHYFVKQIGNERLPLSKLMLVAQDTLGPSIHANEFEFKTDENAAVVITAYHENDISNPLWYSDTREYFYHVYLDPYTGEVLKVENGNVEFFQIVLWLHLSLLFDGAIGRPIVGVATIIFVFSLVTGIVLWWPKNKKARKQRLWFRWKPTTKWKRKNFDLHNIFGFYSMIFALLLALTGLVWAFKWYESGVKWLVNGGEHLQRTAYEPVSDQIKINSRYDVLETAYYETLYRCPNTKYIYIALPEDSSEVIKIYAYGETKSDMTSIRFNESTGECIESLGFDDLNTGEKFKYINYDIHVGSILGFPGKVLAFLVSLISASLPITGFLVWWGRKNKGKKVLGENYIK